jgi:uracil-DNA glycosylase
VVGTEFDSIRSSPGCHHWTRYAAKATFSILCFILSPIPYKRHSLDPYHGPGQAHGLCFSVLPGQAIPPSLKNVYRELNEDSQIKFLMPRHGHLIRWAKQGVLMLNACMSVRRGEANSHQKKGWENLTDEIVRAVDRQSKKSGQRVVFLLWGKPATAKAQALIGSNSSVNRHVVICTSHPSPLGARKTNQPFLGSKCFSRCNQALTEVGCGAIDWNVDD